MSSVMSFAHCSYTYSWRSEPKASELKASAKGYIENVSSPDCKSFSHNVQPSNKVGTHNSPASGLQQDMCKFVACAEPNVQNV